MPTELGKRIDEHSKSFNKAQSIIKNRDDKYNN